MPAAEPLDFRPCDPEEEPARSLLAAMVGELTDLYAITTGRLGVALEPQEMTPPGGLYLVGSSGDEAVCGGGLRTIGPEMGEIKRMYVAPRWRGRGVARRLLAALEDAAAGLGMKVVRLDTGPSQPDARHLYESAGYRSIENYNDNEHAAFWGEKAIPPR